MTPTTRFVRQFLILLAFFVVAGAVAWLAYRAVVPSSPEPTPDPTAFLKPISVKSVDILEVKELNYDFVAYVNNPNSAFGSPNVRYAIDFKDGAGGVISEFKGSFYILPSQSKHIVATNITIPQEAASADMRIESIDWQELSSLAGQGVKLPATKKAFSILGDGHRFAYAEGQIFNNSDFDIAKADVAVILINAQKNPVAVNTTEIMTFLSNTTRGFEVSWFTPFEGEADDVIIEANTNIFNNANFIRAYGGIERFQQEF